MAVRSSSETSVASSVLGTNQTAQEVPSAKHSIVQLQFRGANRAVELSEVEMLGGKLNYIQGNDPSLWRLNIPTYAEIAYKEMYPGITLTYRGDGGRLKGTYLVEPGANPGRISWHYTGARQVMIDQDGNLQITVTGDKGSMIVEQAPVAWQVIDGKQVAVQTAYKVAPDGWVSFQLGAYDEKQLLLIDPYLIFSTYLGGTGIEDGSGIARDAQGNIYVAGSTASTNFPLHNPYQPIYGGGPWDAFVAKLDPTGTSLIYSTYLGGS